MSKLAKKSDNKSESVSKKDDCKPVVKRAERELRVTGSSTSKIIKFDDIDKIVFRVVSTASKESAKDKEMKYRDIVIQGKLESESTKEFRAIRFALPKPCYSPSGVSTRYSDSLGIYFDMTEAQWKANKEKLMVMRSNLARALLEKYDEIASDCGMNPEAEGDKKRLKEIDAKLSKIVKPSKPKNGAKVNLDKQYMNLDCKFTTFMCQNVDKDGKPTKSVKRVKKEDLELVKLVHNTTVKMGNLRGINSAIGISFIADQCLIKSAEPCTQDVVIEDGELEEDESTFVDVLSKLAEIKAAAKAEAEGTDSDMLKDMTTTGKIGSSPEDEFLEKSESEEDIDDLMG
jgi:hypothetical protein